MKTIYTPKEYLLFPAFFLLFIINENQVGIGILGFQRGIVREAGHDAWISVLIAGLASHLIAWIMLKSLSKYPSTDLFGIHQEVFGQWLGMMLSLLYVCYLASVALIILRNYIEIVQTWIFPRMPTSALSIAILSVVIYGILGGIRVVVGACFLSLCLTSWMVLLLFFPLEYTDPLYIRPIYDAATLDILKGAKQMGLTIIGFEILYFLHPFVKDKNKAKWFVHGGLLTTTILYTIIILVCILYFSEEQLLKTFWPTLSLFKIVQFPFLERFEYLGVSLWLLVILPNLMLYIWAASYGIKRLFPFKQKYALYLISLLIFLLSISLVSRHEINRWNEIIGELSIYLVFCYPVLLYLMTIIHRKRKGGSPNETV